MSSNGSSVTLLDLPVDLLLLIFPYLDAASFLSLTSTCRALHNPDFVEDAMYWSDLVRHQFRVPNQPVVQNDGRRWKRLYKRMRTQSKIFSWGNDDKGCLGQSFDMPNLPGQRRPVMRRSRHISCPGEMEGTEQLGIISDMQCGGWSTSLLTSKGALYTCGVLDGLQFNQRRPPYMQQPKRQPTALRFPSGMPQPKDRYDPVTAIKQFSSGRSHVLALSDTGRIWSWQDIELPGMHVKFVHHSLTEDGRERGTGVVKKVVAGWNKSVALIEGSGIVVWEPLQLSPEECDTSDAALVLESTVVPRTRYVESQNRKTAEGSSEGEDVGEVQSFIVLEDSILFNTSLGKVFAALITWTDTAQTVSDPVELSIPAGGEANAEASFVTDIQGSFRNFAVFTKAGDVLTSEQDRVMPLLTNQHTNRRLFTRIPALQNKQVISLAFGDYHFHALHSTGEITSYGYEPQSCGALGLGGHGVPEGRLRGIRNRGIGGDGHLVPHAYTEGRRVWFEKEKQEWISFITSGGADPQEGAARVRMAIGSPGPNAQGEVSEWIEQEGRDWEGKFGIRGQGEEDDGLGAYFALSVSAAGWHSGALVLVNEDMAEKLRKAVEVPEHPPGEEPQEDVASSAQPSYESSRATPSTSDTAPSNETILDRAADWGRYFLGLAPYNVNDAAYDPNAAHLRTNTTARNQPGPSNRHNPQSQNFGASPRPGYKYIWADDHFPRLRLSDGTEMPGEVPFHEWRYGRPEWNLAWEDGE
ncbi:hypothetical protein M409DRAFT_27510 [Zasmidium cellare ATCC 36951]|uniref:F-box domain-containing protein n=1 Tax=Zasmidium cellare ATCC 36951 TaxID=1080233 RepID=A0A6A6C7A0_ZASCE|nr:uncharacterized protein M409DRAFT_27510 [Zasmidium cellare ATCC 36951]KAF2162128.1 hypothetical protein M409DRAFT_27510 [Zasmidium cellare ATCC 36951]